MKKSDVVVDVDEHPKPKTTLETLAKLPTVFKKDGVVTAGSASVSDLSLYFTSLFYDFLFRKFLIYQQISFIKFVSTFLFIHLYN